VVWLLPHDTVVPLKIIAKHIWVSDFFLHFIQFIWCHRNEILILTSVQYEGYSVFKSCISLARRVRSYFDVSYRSVLRFYTTVTESEAIWLRKSRFTFLRIKNLLDNSLQRVSDMMECLHIPFYYFVVCHYMFLGTELETDTSSMSA